MAWAVAALLTASEPEAVLLAGMHGVIPTAVMACYYQQRAGREGARGVYALKAEMALEGNLAILCVPRPVQASKALLLLLLPITLLLPHHVLLYLSRTLIGVPCSLLEAWLYRGERRRMTGKEQDDV